MALSDLYKKDQYVNSNIPFIISNIILEYDIKSAGLNILYRANKISDREYRYLSGLDKTNRNIQIGLMIRDNPDLSNTLKEGFEDVRRIFFLQNDLIDRDILSIKKDAIFVINKRPSKLMVDNLEFINKNIYTGYYNLNGIEFYYYIREDLLDVKGISDIVVEQHSEYFIAFLKRIFRLAERSDHKIVRRNIREFSNDYKNFKLDVEYYRELNYESSFKIKYFGNMSRGLVISEVDRSMLKSGLIDISYNYMRYIIPLINIFS